MRTIHPRPLVVAGLAGLALGALPAALTAGAGSPPRGQAMCRGQVATHVDTDGGNGNDVIVVTQPSISVNGWAGDDLICVMVPGEYGAYVRGGNGRDTIITYSGVNHVFGGADGDSLLSNAPDALLDGEEGDDTIYLGQYGGLAYGGDGNDRIFGSPHADEIHAGRGNDLLLGFEGDDELVGGEDDDRLEGGTGADDLDGVGGNDECVDTAAPATTFTSCETIVGLGVAPGPGGLATG